MQGVLVGGDWQQLQRLGLELLDPAQPARQQELVLSTLLRVVPGEVAGEIEVDRLTARARVAEYPRVLVAEGAAPAAVLASNPVVPHVARSGELAATRVTDLCDAATWRRNPMRQEVLVPAGVPYALVCGYSPRPGTVRGWGINRDREFTDTERDRLEVFSAFLRRAAAAREQALLLNELTRAAAAGAGVLVTDGRRVLHANGEAQRLIDHHQLPTARLAELLAALHRRGEAQTTARTPRGVLRLRAQPGAGPLATIVLDEVPDPAQHARDAGLTARQHEVLLALAEGSTAEAIAHRLTLSPRTVHKHLEQVYRRLGAHDRLDAVTRARERGLLATSQKNRAGM